MTTIGQKLIESAKEALAFARGEPNDCVAITMPARILRPIDFVLDELKAKNISKRILKKKILKLIDKQTWFCMWYHEFIFQEMFVPYYPFLSIVDVLGELKICSKNPLIHAYCLFEHNAKNGFYRYDEKLKCLVKKIII